MINNSNNEIYRLNLIIFNLLEEEMNVDDEFRYIDGDIDIQVDTIEEYIDLIKKRIKK